MLGCQSRAYRVIHSGVIHPDAYARFVRQNIPERKSNPDLAAIRCNATTTVHRSRTDHRSTTFEVADKPKVQRTSLHSFAQTTAGPLIKQDSNTNTSSLRLSIYYHDPLAPNRLTLEAQRVTNARSQGPVTAKTPTALLPGDTLKSVIARTSQLAIQVPSNDSWQEGERKRKRSAECAETRKKERRP